MSNRKKAKNPGRPSQVRRGHFQLRVIPEPKPGTRSVIISASTDPDFVFMQGALEGIEFGCGNCGRILMRGVAPGQVVNVVLKCPSCGHFNDTGPGTGQ